MVRRILFNKLIYKVTLMFAISPEHAWHILSCNFELHPKRSFLFVLFLQAFLLNLPYPLVCCSSLHIPWVSSIHLHSSCTLEVGRETNHLETDFLVAK